LANETKATKKKKNNELIQLLLSVFIIGVFVMIEVWLIFFYCSRYGYDNSTFLFPFIFGLLTILMVCINTLNIYQIFVKRVSVGGGSDKKAEFLIYKQVKSLPDAFKIQLDELNAEIEKTQKKTAKAILIKVDEQLKQMKEEIVTGQGNGQDSAISEQLEAIKSDVESMKTQLSELKDSSENISNILKASSVDHEKMLENFPELQNEHKKVFDLLGSLTFRNDEIKEMLDKLTPIEQGTEIEIGNDDGVSIEEISLGDLPETEETPHEEPAPAPVIPEVSGDPNKQLSPDEIAALFANV